MDKIVLPGSKRKRPRRQRGLFGHYIRVSSLRDYVGRTWALFALSNIKLDLLAFLKIGVAGRLDFGVVDEQILAAVIRRDKSKALFSIKPFYCTCAHYICSPGLLRGHKLTVSHTFLREYS